MECISCFQEAIRWLKGRQNPATDWAHLPPELLQLISNKLTDIFDYIQFRSVCASWRHAVGSTDLVHHQLPWLMLPTRRRGTSEISFLRLSHPSRVYTRDLHETRGKWVFGSSYGWLLMIDKRVSSGGTVSVSLLNPITRAQILLPQLPTEPLDSGTLQKAVLCSHPASCRPGQFLVVLLTHRKILSIFRQGDNDWTLIKSEGTRRGLADIIHMDNKVCGIDIDRNLSVLSVLQARTLQVRQLVGEGPCKVRESLIARLVEVSGNLLLLTWCPEGPPHMNQLTADKFSNWQFRSKRVDNMDVTEFLGSFCTSSSVYAQHLPDKRVSRIYLAQSDCDLTTHIRVIDVNDSVCITNLDEKPYLQAPIRAPKGFRWRWRSRTEWISSGPAWFIPQLN